MVLKSYKLCTLEEAGKVRFQRREDTKYLCDRELLYKILEDLQDYYYVLAINGEGALPYITSYFDTADDDFYLMHHNKNYARYKFRRRYYPASGDHFFEVKVKSNKKITFKHRLPISDVGDELTKEEYNFLGEIVNDKTEQYLPAIIAEFNRITLVKKDFTERCTIDTNLRFDDGKSKDGYENLVIIEVKNEQHISSGPMRTALRENHVRQASFSKYCMGRALLNPSLKQNNFKEIKTFINNHITQ